jgi:hypothetical protein
MLGAPQETQHSQEDHDLVNQVKADINAKCGHQHESFKIVKSSSQVVAGTNKFYHLKAQPGDHDLTVTIHVPLPHTNAPPSVEQVSEGHKPLNLGHGSN